MPSTSRTRGRKAAVSSAAQSAENMNSAIDSEAETLDNALDDWSQTTAKEQIAWEISAANAMLRNAQALSEAQLDSARRTQKAHEQAALQLEQAQDINELAAVQMSLARADAQSLLEHWSRIGQTATRGALEAWSEAMSGCARLQNAAVSSWLQWSKLQQSVPANPEVLEAEMEHVANPVAATPLVWPAQEATRQAMTLAASTWNDWLSWTGKVMGNGDARH